jgi:hypothetical protein
MFHPAANQATGKLTIPARLLFYRATAAIFVMLTSVWLERKNEADNIGVYCSDLHERTRAESKDTLAFALQRSRRLLLHLRCK